MKSIRIVIPKKPCFSWWIFVISPVHELAFLPEGVDWLVVSNCLILCNHPTSWPIFIAHSVNLWSREIERARLCGIERCDLSGFGRLFVCWVGVWQEIKLKKVGVVCWYIPYGGWIWSIMRGNTEFSKQAGCGINILQDSSVGASRRCNEQIHDTL